MMRLQQRPGPLIRNWQTGGNWRVTYQAPELDAAPPQQFHDTIPHNVVNKIIRYRKNNDLPARADHVWQVCNRIWGERYPHRYEGDVRDLERTANPFRGQVIAGSNRRVLDARDFGPWVWQFLNTFGIHFEAELFRAAVRQAEMLVHPRRDNLGSGCADCWSHFRETLLRYPVQNVETREEARVWVWIAHDRANKASGSRKFTFGEIARIYGWPRMDAATFEKIESKLKGETSK